jgi:hypothetical protein
MLLATLAICPSEPGLGHAPHRRADVLDDTGKDDRHVGDQRDVGACLL